MVLASIIRAVRDIDLMIDVEITREPSASLHQTTQHNIPECIPHRRLKNQKSHMKSNVSGQEIVAGFHKHDNDISGCIKSGKFLDQLSNYQLLKEYNEL
jgi:hypothetical protein